MRQYNDGTYRRINKTEARRRYEAGEEVTLIPCNLRIDNCWGLALPVARDYWSCEGLAFDKVVNEAECFNCNAETGRYLAYYTKEA